MSSKITINQLKSLPSIRKKRYKQSLKPQIPYKRILKKSELINQAKYTYKITDSGLLIIISTDSSPSSLLRDNYNR